MGRPWGYILLSIWMRYHSTFYAVSQTKLQIINLNTVPRIICRWTNETQTHRNIFTQYSGISSHSYSKLILNILFFHVFLRSLVLILPVPRVRGAYRRSFFFLLNTDFTYSRVRGDQGGPIFFRLKFFFAVVLYKN